MFTRPPLLVLLFFACLFFINVGARTELLQQRVQVKVGDLAPDFTLEDQDLQKTTLSASRGKNPVVLVFYRGYW